ncbi:hypothetical protein PLICRDRAFT_57870 [Plicaturopsis crispa FD-325 SS-3]|uniref:Amidase domain-containing protein n=1 Tax=Plicaturopsis crispa FD-325 SS-3 TaxID=944288 RepID=A0A0C9SWZ2_PLICR|nr:hypothetical protein PLICRDRAFT_57870 [Plicaturopsis crispa FD-325 SS-3]
MSVISTVVSPGNPITSQDVIDAVAGLGPGIKPTAHLDEWTTILAGAHEVLQSVMDEPDYIPDVDEERFPRTNLHRPEPHDNPLNAWAWKFDLQDTTGQAAQGLLAGKTLAIKDNVCIKGVPCLMGTEVITNWTPNTDATVVTRILEAGGLIKGKAVCENLSLLGVSYSAATGPVENPWAKGYSAAGSSSGTAALIASGAVDMGIGGDQGGSIRLPASHTGIVGMKPTYGLIPYTGIASLEASIDHTGPMARTVLDAALLLQAIAGTDGIDDRQQAGCPSYPDTPNYPALAAKGIEGYKIGILTESLVVPTADPRVSELVVKAAKQFAELGATVEEVSVPIHLKGDDFWMALTQVGAVQAFLGHASGRRGLILNDLQEKITPLTQDKFDKIFPLVAPIFINGLYGAKQFPNIMGKVTNLTRKLRDAYDAALSKYDVLIMPTVPWVPVKIPSPETSRLDQFNKFAGLARNTCPTDLTGHPSLSIPVGLLSPTDESEKVKLPIGMQIVGPWWKDDKVLAVGHAWEKSNDWKSFA